jgi:hypothetical protein
MEETRGNREGAEDGVEIPDGEFRSGDEVRS